MENKTMDFEGRDIYDIYEREGKKFIHVLGFISYNGDSWSDEQYCGIDFPLISLLIQQDDGYSIREFMEDKEEEAKMYGEYNMTDEEALFVFDKYNNGARPKPLSYDMVELNTPCGVYYDNE